LLADAADSGAYEAIVRRYPNSAWAEDALLLLTRKPDAETRAPALTALAALLAAEPATPARQSMEEALARWRGTTRLADAPLTRRWQTHTRISQRKAELLALPGMPPGLLTFALARRSYTGGVGYAGVECREPLTGRLVWKRDLSGWNRLAVVSGGSLVLATFDRVVALDPRSGVERWTRSLAPGDDGKPADMPDDLEDPAVLMRRDALRRRESHRIRAIAAGANTVFVGQTHGRVSAFDSATGEPAGTVQLDTKALLANGLVVDNGVLWACIEDTPALFEVDTRAGTSRKAFTIPSLDPRITAQPVHDAGRGRLYLEVADKTVYAFDLRARRGLWDTRIPFAINGFLLSERGARCIVIPYSYVGQAEILLLDADTGKVVRRRSLQTGALSHATLGADALYFTEKDTGRNVVLHALDPGSLAQRWQSVPLPLFKPSPLAIGDGFVAVCGRRQMEDVAIVVDAETGKVAADMSLDGAASVTPGATGGLLCLGTDRGLLAFAPTNRESLDRRIADLTRQWEAGDPSALPALANALYQRGDEERAIAFLARALAAEDLDDAAYAGLKDQLDSLRESLAERRPAVLVTSRFATPPNIDGAINESWRADHAIPLDGPAYVDAIQGYTTAQSRWASPSDLSGMLYTGWDDDYFYFAVDVKDDIHRSYTSRHESWVGDGLIISIDSENDGGYGYRFDGRDILLTLALTQKDEHQEDEDEDDDEPRGEYRVRRKDDNSGTVYEIAIPWKYLRLAPRPGLKFGFNVTVTDDDGDHATKTLSWTPGMVLDRSRSLLIRGFLPAYFGDVHLTGSPRGPRPVSRPKPRARRDKNLWIRRIR
ncbi:PQQ-binding-like beta-propeller repeat protein, partial [bacterium]|nr:PQQ-binding-like beta-propeller repeat protein [bacterium]